MNFNKLVIIVSLMLVTSVKANVIITGKITNAKAGMLSLEKTGFFLTEFLPEKVYISERVENSFTCNLSINQPQVIYFRFSGTFIGQSILVTPGDTIAFVIDDKKLIFSGKNQGAYNFLGQMEELFNLRTRPRYKKYENLTAYKIALNDWFSKRRDFLNTFAKTENLTTNAFTIFKEGIEYDYTFYLYEPLTDPSVDRTKIPIDYLDNTTNFNRDDLLLATSSNYGGALIRKYLYEQNIQPYAKINQVYNNAISELKGKTRDYFISNMIGLFAENASKNGNENDKAILVEIIKKEKKRIKDTTFLAYILKQEDNLLLLDKNFSNLVLDNTILTSYSGQQLTLRQMLAQHKDKAIYIDFWASWCSPCREDIKNSADAKALLTEKGVSFIYLSVDKDQALWKKAAEEDNIIANQFLVKNGLKSTLGLRFGVNYIPRYFYLDKNHLVKSIYAPRPTQIKELKSLVNPPTVVRF